MKPIRKYINDIDKQIVKQKIIKHRERLKYHEHKIKELYQKLWDLQ